MPEYDHLVDDARGDSTCGREGCGHSFDWHSVLEPGCGCSIEDCAGRIERLTEVADQASRNVVQEITDEIDAGNSHLLTRNELADFINWWVNHSRLPANEVIYLAMEHGETGPNHEILILKTIRDELAHEYFVEKGYEK